MPLFKNKYKTESNRLENWDYSSEGIYFITLTAYNRECLFGTIEKEEMILNHNGQIVERELLKSIEKPFISRTPIWQSNYHDHIIRNYKSLEKK
jgi:hypothetical protein